MCYSHTYWHYSRDNSVFQAWKNDNMCRGGCVKMKCVKSIMIRKNNKITSTLFISLPYNPGYHLSWRQDVNNVCYHHLRGYSLWNSGPFFLPCMAQLVSWGVLAASDTSSQFIPTMFYRTIIKVLRHRWPRQNIDMMYQQIHRDAGFQLLLSGWSESIPQMTAWAVWGDLDERLLP